MKKSSGLLLIAVCFLFTQCYTIFTGTRVRVAVSTNVTNPVIKLNDKVLPASDGTVQVISISKKMKQPKLEVSAEGYEPQVFTITRSKKMGQSMMAMMGIVLGSSGILTGVMIETIFNAESSIPTSTLYTPPVEEKTNTMPYYVGGALLMLSGIVDLSSGACNTFAHRKLHFDLAPVPKNAMGDKADYISCSSVNFKIQPGKKIGTVYRSRSGEFNRDKDKIWEETSNVNVTDMEVQVNNDLHNAGYPVPGLKDKFNSNDRASARYLLRADIENAELDDYINDNYTPIANQPVGGNVILMSSDVDQHCKLNVNWSLYDNRKHAVVFERKIESAYWGNESSFKGVALRCISGGLKKLLSDTAFVAAISKKALSPTEAGTSGPIEISKAKPASKLTDIIESAITIDMGNGHGSGFIISSDGYALTNYHVIGQEKKLNIILSSGLNLTADVVNVDETTDVALIKISGKGFKPAALAAKDDATIGSDVVAVGTPGRIDLGQSISKGIISGKREVEGAVYLQTDVSISPGNSGGPLFNSQNEVIGIINSKLVGKGIEGVGFAIPIGIALSKLHVKVN
jgi:serine protease Do